MKFTLLRAKIIHGWIILFTIVINLLYQNIGKANELFGIGVYVGAQQDIGNLNSYYPNIQIDPQNNLLLGFSFKANLYCFFVKSWVDTTFFINRGEVQENSDEMEYIKIHYASIPIFAGLTFPILYTSEFYMGGGAASFLGRGKIKCSSSNSVDEFDTNTWGIGLLAGIGLDISLSVRCYIEWEYLDGRSEPVSQTQLTYNWQNYYVDFTGHRIIIGIMYYLI